MIKPLKSTLNCFFKEEDSCRGVPEGINFNVLSDIDREWLNRPFTEDEEVKQAVWSCDGNKSVGPDGYSLEFYKQNWEVVKMDIISFVCDFYEKAILTKSCTSYFITLIPKIKNPQSLSEYRPICIVGSLYKILAKILASRLRSIIGNLVSKNETAFVPGRNILDGVLVVNEVLDILKRKKMSCVVGYNC